jgi:ribonucleoside-diphosphate reductase alpha chain
MSKFPFQKVYGKVHGTRKIGLGLMGWAEMLAQLKIPYDSNEAVNLARDISYYVTETARKKSVQIAEERGVFPFWEGSVWEKQGKKVRNATATTIAPNGSTGMICNTTGGIEPFFKLAFKKTCMDGKELIYRNTLLEGELWKVFQGEKLEEILHKIDETGTIRGIEEIPEEIRRVYATSHEVAPEWHVKMQAAFQTGRDGVGVDNAVSKTVNLPENATTEDIKKIYTMAYEEGCVGITIFRDNCKKGVLSKLETKVKLVQNSVKSPPMIESKAQAFKYKVKRQQNGDSLHIMITSDLYVDDKSSKAYFIPSEIFQTRAPIGHAVSASFAQSGIDRTEILRGPNPDYAELISRLQSVYSNEEEGLGPRRIKSIEHAVGVVLEDCLLKNGIVGHDELNKLTNLVEKQKLRKVEYKSEEYHALISQVKAASSEEEIEVIGNHGKLGIKFVCKNCGSEKYTFEAGCNHPKCVDCGEVEGGGCG